MKRVSHHGRETAYQRRTGPAGERAADADGPGVCFVHGSGGGAGVWKAQTRLADHTPVTRVDLSGHGESDDVDADAGYETLDAYVDDVLAVIEATGDRVVCGNSLGGAVAMWAVLERDVDLDGLILTGTGARLSVLDDLLRWLNSDFDRAIEFLHGPDRLFHDPTPEFVAASEAGMREAGRAVTERDFRTCHAFDVRNRVADIDLPTLAVVGEYDQLTPAYFHEFFVDEMPDCRMVSIADAAHLAMLEQPAAFNEAVRGFLDDS
jgi:3-oxoadipate enol-lactonase